MADCNKCFHHTICIWENELEEECNKHCSTFKNKADFVEVVRCKDCRHYEPNRERSGFEAEGECNWFDSGVGGLDFCSYGERSDT